MTGFDSKRRMAQDKLKQPEPPAEWPLIKNILAEYGLDAIAFVAEWKAALEQPEQEPVAYFDFQQLKFTWAKHMKIGPVPVTIKVEPMALYTTPPQRKPLTDEDLQKLADKHLFYQPEGYEVSGIYNLARAIEAAHNIKEGT